MYNEEWYWQNRQSAEERHCAIFYQDLSIATMSPHVLMRPNLSIDGNQWCALYGENLQEGVAGFGDSIEKAMVDFDKNWTKPL